MFNIIITTNFIIMKCNVIKVLYYIALINPDGLIKEKPPFQAKRIVSYIHF